MSTFNTLSLYKQYKHKVLLGYYILFLDVYVYLVLPGAVRVRYVVRFPVGPKVLSERRISLIHGTRVFRVLSV